LFEISRACGVVDRAGQISRCELAVGVFSAEPFSAVGNAVGGGNGQFSLGDFPRVRAFF